MKCKLVRSDLEVGPKAYSDPVFQLDGSMVDRGYGAEFVAANSEPTGKMFGGKETRRWKWGTVIEHPTIPPLLVRQGVAIPADEECRKAAGLTEQQMASAQAHYDQLKVDGSYIQALVAKANRPRIIDEEDDE